MVPAKRPTQARLHPGTIDGLGAAIGFVAVLVLSPFPPLHVTTLALAPLGAGAGGWCAWVLRSRGAI